MKVKTDYAGCKRITPGKEYEAKRLSGVIFEVVDDINTRMIINVKKCAHLQGRAWDIVG